MHQQVQEVQDLQPTRKVHLPQRFDPVAPVPDDRPMRRFIESALGCLRRHHPSERLGPPHRRHRGAEQTLRSFDHGLHRRLGAGLGGRRAGRGVRPHLLNLLAQAHDMRRVEECFGRLGLRVCFAAGGDVGQEASHLRVRPVRLAHPGLPVVLPQLNLAGVQVDGRHTRRLGVRGRQLARLHPLDVAVSLGGPLLPNTLGDPLDVLGADRQFRQAFERLGRLME